MYFIQIFFHTALITYLKYHDYRKFIDKTIICAQKKLKKLRFLECYLWFIVVVVVVTATVRSCLRSFEVRKTQDAQKIPYRCSDKAQPVKKKTRTFEIFSRVSHVLNLTQDLALPQYFKQLAPEKSIFKNSQCFLNGLPIIPSQSN